MQDVISSSVPQLPLHDDHGEKANRADSQSLFLPEHNIHQPTETERNDIRENNHNRAKPEQFPRSPYSLKISTG